MAATEASAKSRRCVWLRCTSTPVSVSTPAEYARPGHVDDAVVDEIATWLTDGR